MSSTWELKEKSKGELKVALSGEEWQKACDKAFKKVAKNVNIPGFRKGSAPAAIVKKHVSKQSVWMEAIDATATALLVDGVKEHELDLIARPEMNIDDVNEDGYKLTFFVTVRPEVTLGDYKGLDIKKKRVSVSAKEVDEEVNALQKRYAELVVKEGDDAVVENGDTAEIDFEGFKDGIPFDGGKAEKFPLEIGSGQFIPGFEEQLVGMKAEESKEIQVTFPENYHAEELAGAPVTFKVTVHEIKAKEQPEINDDLIKEANIKDVETVEAYREYAKKNLSEQKKRNAENEYNNAILSKLCEVCPVEIPQVMIDDEVEYLYRDFASRIQSQGFTIDQFKAMTGQSEESIREELAKDAASKVNIRLVLEAIAKAEKIEASEAECDEEIKRIAGLYGMDEKVVRERIGDQVKYDVCNRKALDLVKESAGK